MGVSNGMFESIQIAEYPIFIVSNHLARRKIRTLLIWIPILVIQDFLDEPSEISIHYDRMPIKRILKGLIVKTFALSKLRFWFASTISLRYPILGLSHITVVQVFESTQIMLKIFQIWKYLMRIFYIWCSIFDPRKQADLPTIV